MSLAGLEHGGQGDRRGCGSSLVAERQGWSCLVRSSPGLPSYAVAGAAVGAGCQSAMELLEEFPLLRACLAVSFALGKTGHFYFALVSFSLFWRLGVDLACTSLGSTVDTCS